MDDSPQFERADDRFLGMTKTQFTMLAAAAALIATTLSAVSLSLWVHTSAQRRQDFCNAVNTTNSSIRVVLNASIAQGEKELKDPQFVKYRKQIEAGIALDTKWRDKLFANQVC